MPFPVHPMLAVRNMRRVRALCTQAVVPSGFSKEMRFSGGAPLEVFAFPRAGDAAEQRTHQPHWPRAGETEEQERIIPTSRNDDGMAWSPIG